MSHGQTGEWVMKEVAVPGIDGDLTGVLFSPAGRADEGPRPAVLVHPEIDGFCEGTVAAARRLAAAGYVALALDPFTPYGSTPVLTPREATTARLAGLNDRRQLSELPIVLAWLRDLPEVAAERMAVLGFSVGGRYAMMLTTEPHGVQAVVTFYARPWPGGPLAEVGLSPGKYVDRFNAPLCAIFGDDDDLIPLEMVEEFRSLLAQQPSSGHELHIVPGGHFFANESRRRYVPESAELAWARVLAFLSLHLKGGT
jgi:carboxymethylenebutenolidase